MSFIRMGSTMKYVKGISKDYVYSNGKEIIDYGSIKTESIIEIIMRIYNKDQLLTHLMKRLAENTKIKLR